MNFVLFTVYCYSAEKKNEDDLFVKEIITTEQPMYCFVAEFTKEKLEEWTHSWK